MRRKTPLLVFVLVLIALTLLSDARVAAQADNPFRRGDVNFDANLDISDGVSALGILFTGGDAPDCEDALDANDDGSFDISDPVTVLNHLFLGGGVLPAPFPDCGVDPTPDVLDCFDPGPCFVVECFDEADLDALITENLPPTTCLLADLAEFEVAGALVTVCPTAEAPSCGPEGDPGCPLGLAATEASLDVEGRRVEVFVAGTIDALPVRIDAGFLGRRTCDVTIDFTGVISLDFVAEPGDAGLLEVVRVGEPRIDEVETDLAVEGDLLCELLETQEDLLLENSIDLLEEFAAEAIVGLESELLGITLCAP